jgi:hypothetical protein
LEVKMLRMLQADLNARTRELPARLDALGTPPNDEERSALLREAEELQVEQGRLATLVEEMLTRDNEKAGQ